MASAATALNNDSSDDRSGTEMDDMEEEHQEEEYTEESDFDDAFSIDVFRHSNGAWKLPQSSMQV
jgi:ribosomal protein L12E/L44/L45/RPP1/RPP2